MTSPHRTTAFKGALFTVGMRWTDRLMGLISTLILARLLTPADFGLVAMAMVVVGLIDVLLDLGVGAALIQNNAADRADFDTAWTLRLCQASVAATIVAGGAPLAAEYYSDSRVMEVMWVIAVSVFVGGFENIGIVLFQKDMEFGRDFRFFFAKRTLGTIVTIALAFALRSYWALVLGSLVGRVIGVGLSYAMHPYRPAWTFARVRRIWAFSQWNMVSSTASYLSRALDKLVVGRRADASVMGAYSVGDEIASLPTTELLAPLGRVMFPAFALARHDQLEFRRIVLLAFSLQALVGIPAGIGVTLIAPEAVPVLLGDHWKGAIPFVQVLGLVGVATALIHCSQYMLLALGRVKTLAMYFLFQFLALLVLLVGVFPRADAQGVAESRLAVAIVGLAVMQFLARSALPGFGLRAMIRQAWRPLIAAVAMTVAVLGVGTGVLGPGAIAILAAKVAVGALTYGLTVMLLWRLAGCPEGSETYLLAKVGLKRVQS